MLEDKIERLRKLQKESRALSDEILTSLQGKCKETLFEVLEVILDNVDEFPDTETAVRAINEVSSRHAHKKEKESSKRRRKETDE